MEFRGIYDRVSRWAGWLGWAIAVGGALYVNAIHPFIDQALVLLVWPILAGITVRPLIRLAWPLLVLSAGGAAVYAPAGAVTLAVARKLL
jgi:hypothetical protein